ncbi:hypothetical protein TYRP_022418 [Tyrophagus putrescentiae]|nr:hypothetical protein TYRP_022418 [Tyrophagus putrescentiae]
MPIYDNIDPYNINSEVKRLDLSEWAEKSGYNAVKANNAKAVEVFREYSGNNPFAVVSMTMRHFSPNVIHVCSDLPYRRLPAPNRPFEDLDPGGTESNDSEVSDEEDQPDEESDSPETDLPPPYSASVVPPSVGRASEIDSSGDSDPDAPVLVASLQPAPRRARVNIDTEVITQVPPAGHSR